MSKSIEVLQSKITRELIISSIIEKTHPIIYDYEYSYRWWMG